MRPFSRVIIKRILKCFSFTALSLKPDDPLVYKLRAEVRGKIGLTEEAVADYIQALNLQEYASVIWLQRLWFLQQSTQLFFPKLKLICCLKGCAISIIACIMFCYLYNPSIHFNNIFILYINYKASRSFSAYLRKLIITISS